MPAWLVQVSVSPAVNPALMLTEPDAIVVSSASVTVSPDSSVTAAAFSV